MMSGALLYYRYKGEMDVFKFYRKRWESIYPEFWLLYGCFFIKNATSAGTLFYKGRPWMLLLSLFGVDGYFKYRIDNYYILGEWFLGAIIMIYLLYPILLRIFQRAPLVLSAMLLLLCLAIENVGFFQISLYRNLIFCIFEFEIGMLLMKHREKLRGPICIISCLLIEILLVTVQMPISTGLYTILSSAALYLLLGEVGVWTESRSRRFAWIVGTGAGISYSAYLLHRHVLKGVLRIWNPTQPLGEMVVFVICIFVLFVCAWIYHTIVSRLLRLMR